MLYLDKISWFENEDSPGKETMQCGYPRAAKAAKGAWPFVSVHVVGASNPCRDALNGCLCPHAIAEKAQGAHSSGQDRHLKSEEKESGIIISSSQKLETWVCSACIMPGPLHVGKLRNKDSPWKSNFCNEGTTRKKDAQPVISVHVVGACNLGRDALKSRVYPHVAAVKEQAEYTC